MSTIFKRNRLSTLIGGIALSLSITDAAYGVDIFSNAITDGNPSLANPFTAGQVVDPNITVSGLGRGAGIAGTTASNRYNANNFTLSSTIDTSDYFTWTLTPNAGYEIDFTALTGNWQRSNSGPASYAFRSSIDGFVSDFNFGAVASGTSAFNIDLTTFQNITTPIEFRLYGWASTNTTGTLSINDFIFDGTVSLATGSSFPYWDANGAAAGVGGTGTWDTTSSLWNTLPDGSGTLSTYNSANLANFGGTSGTVTIAAGGITANAGVQFDATGYTIAGDSLTLGSTNTLLSVSNAAHTATIDSTISGTNGITKGGAGTLVLGGANNFTGPVRVNVGTLSISSDGNLGDAANPITLAGGTLQTAVDLALVSTRSVNGNGALDVAEGKTLTINGTVGDTTSVALSIVNTGTTVFAGSTNSLLSLAFTNGGTLSVTGADLSLGGNITTTNTIGTATVAGNINWGTGVTRTVMVANGSAATDLLLSGNISGGVVLQKFGSGTLTLTGNNSGLSGNGTTPASVRLGNAGTTPTEGGVLEFNNADALGTGQLQLNAGTLRNTSGGPLTINNVNGISTGAQDHANSPGGLVFDGGNMTFTGPFALFKASTTGYQHRITVNNTTTLDASIGISTGSGTTTGLTIGGTGKLVLNNATNDADFPITVQDATLEINGGLTASALTVAPTGKVVTNTFQLGATSALTVDGLATVRENGGTAGASKVETLTVGATGKLDLKDNDLVVGTAANVDAVRTAIVAGKANNAASGITSDLPAFGTTTGFGYAMGNDAALSPLLAGSLTGQSYDPDSVLVKYTFLGDADLDGDSDLNDLGLWAQAFTGDLGNPASPATYWTSGDFDYDGDTDLNDLGFWAGTFTGDLGGGAGSLVVVAPNAPAGAVAALNSMGITVVPEPSTFVLAGVGLAGLAFASRRTKRLGSCHQ